MKHGSGSIMLMGMLFSTRDWETCKDRGNNEWSQIQANSWGEPASEWKTPETAVKIYILTGQWPQAYSQSNTRMDSEQEHESPQVAQPKPRLESHWESVERLEDCCSPMLPIQLDRASSNLQGRMRENPQIQMCTAGTNIPKKTRSCTQLQKALLQNIDSGGWILM